MGKKNAIPSEKPVEPETEKPVREHRDLRFRNQYFPEAEEVVFDTKRAGFVPLPIIVRKIMRHISPPQLRVLIYLQTRCSKYHICYPTIDEIVYDLDLKGPRNLTPHIKALERKKFIATASGGGKKYYLVHDPRVAIAHLAQAGTITDSELAEINLVLADLKMEAIAAKAKIQKLEVVQKPVRKSKTA